jgi:hypothetical protein
LHRLYQREKPTRIRGFVISDARHKRGCAVDGQGLQAMEMFLVGACRQETRVACIANLRGHFRDNGNAVVLQQDDARFGKAEHHLRGDQSQARCN